MAYISDTARFSILDMIPCDVWQEPEHTGVYGLHGITSDPERYLCIVDEEPYDYAGNFTACTFTAALYQGEHIGVSAEYLRDRCTLADEATARKILAHYIRQWARMEDDDTAALLLEEADRIASAPMFDAIRKTREHYRETAESLTFTSGESGEGLTAAPGYGACIYQKQPGRLYAYVAVCGEIWKPTTFDAVCLINQTRHTFDSRESARAWCAEQATAHGYPVQTARPAYDLFTV